MTCQTTQRREGPTPNEALREAILRAGGMRALGRKLGIGHRAIGGWQQCPPLRVLEIERLTKVAKEELRPDLYPPRRRRRALPDS